jgi:hypothetical protein
MLAAVSTMWPKRVATATPASQTTNAISSVEAVKLAARLDHQHMVGLRKPERLRKPNFSATP